MRTLAFAIAALVLTLTSPTPSRALTLADLDAGGSFVAGALTFDSFDITVGGSLSATLADYTVSVLGDGFSISGPIATLLGEIGGLVVSYQVSAASPILTGATLVAAAETLGTGAYALVSEAMLGPAAEVLGTLLVYDFEGIGADDTDTLVFAPVNRVYVTKSVALGGGEAAGMPLVTQLFSSSAVPEPPAAVLGAVGLLGLVAFARRVHA